MSQERDAFLHVRTLLEAHTSFSSSEIFWGDNSTPRGTLSKAIILEDGGRPENSELPKIGTNLKYFKTSIVVKLLVRVLPDSDAAATAEVYGITTETSGVLDLWKDIENAIGAGTTWSNDESAPSSYRSHNWTPVIPIPLDEHPGWRGRQAEVQIDIGEAHT